MRIDKSERTCYNCINLYGCKKLLWHDKDPNERLAKENGQGECPWWGILMGESYRTPQGVANDTT